MWEGGVPLCVQTEAALVRASLRRGSRWNADGESEQLELALCKLGERGSRRAEALAPFLSVIRSERTSAAVTGLALAALHKFLALGLLGQYRSLRFHNALGSRKTSFYTFLLNNSNGSYVTYANAYDVVKTDF